LPIHQFEYDEHKAILQELLDEQAQFHTTAGAAPAPATATATATATAAEESDDNDGDDDDVIDPADTRKKVIAGLRMLQTKREELPRRKHGNMPL
jgi:acetyl-CoA carboxylase carboxyltransferase component